ncbi:MAG: type III polyketide synthase [Alphaproteobacteria bacterium 64-11]|nr:type III polyketide synthase [Alphaproteobacteria bacterium]OJU10852.1 MAG: type III polyketide synthase [Alphaproteobacteria bacterium 64-11]
MTDAFINRIATAVPPHDVHGAFLDFARLMLHGDNRRLALFNRMAGRSGIARRHSFLNPAHQDGQDAASDAYRFYRLGAFPDTAARMHLYEAFAPGLAAEAVGALLKDEDPATVTHLIIASCTGFAAPGVDLELIARCGLRPEVERTMVGFMGCYAAINALKLARHIVRSEPAARVVTVNLELCTLHLQETGDLEDILSFLLFADGCAASLVTAEPHGAAIGGFHAALVPDSADLIRWNIRGQGFDMVLSGGVPGAVRRALSGARGAILGGAEPDDIALWAVHPGGRTVLDAVEQAFALAPSALATSRGVLHDFGNMSSGTVMFVLDRLMRGAPAGAPGCAMSFGPGLFAETMTFRMAA